MVLVSLIINKGGNSIIRHFIKNNMRHMNGPFGVLNYQISCGIFNYSEYLLTKENPCDTLF
jgi:hypothetical protein